MQLLLMTQKVERVDQANQSKIMISVKMGNKNVRYFAASDLIIDQLNLCAFTTINEIIITVKRNHLAGWVAVKCGYCRVIAEYSDCEHETVSGFELRVLQRRGFTCYCCMHEFRKYLNSTHKT